jgi:hypothetical protein
MFRYFAIFAGVSVASNAQVNTVRVSDEIAPPGGVAQIKVLLTSPQPVSTGRLPIKSKASARVAGVAVFDGTGKTSGTAVIGTDGLNVSILSAGSVLGLSDDYPLLTVTMKIDADAAQGEISSVQLDSTSVLNDAVGRGIALEMKPGTLTIGGTTAITDVIPGGGEVPPGGLVRVLGKGFSPDTKIRIKEAKVARTIFVSRTEMRLQLQSFMRMDGAAVQVRNKNEQWITYFSYLRGIPDGASARPLLASTDPIFSAATWQEAVLPATLSQLNPATFTGLALQNPGAKTSAVTVEQYLGTQRMGKVSLTLAPGHRVLRDVTEWFGGKAPLGAYWHIAASAPVQILGMAGNTTQRTVLPVNVLAVQPGKFPR